MTDRHDLDTLLAESAWVRSLARSLSRSDTDADDLVQDAWTAALRRPPSANRPVRPWLAAVVRNAARARFRAASRRAAREDEVRRPGDDVPSADALLGELELQEQLSALVRGLPEPQREAVVLRFHEGLSGADIARRLGIPPGTVRWRIKSGLDALRAELDRQNGGDRAAWLGALMPLARPRGAAAAAPAIGVAAGLLFVAKLAAASAAAFAVYSLLVAPLLSGGGPGGGPSDLPATPRADGLIARAQASDERESPIVAVSEPDEARADSVVAPRGDAAQDSPPETRLRLRVIDPTGAPVAGADVELSPGLDALNAVKDELEELSKIEQLVLQAQLRAKTDGQGIAEFASTLLRIDANVGVDVVGPLNGAWSDDVAVSPGDSVDLGDVTVTPRGRVFGVLRDARGDAVTGRIMLAPPGSTDPAREAIASGHAGTGGRFEVLLDEAATFQLFVRCYLAEEVEPGGTATVELGASVEMEARTSLVSDDEAPRLLAVGAEGERIEAFFTVEILGDTIIKSSHPAYSDDQFPNPTFLRQADVVRIKATDPTLRHRPAEEEFRPPFGDFVLTLDAAPTRTIQVEVGVAGGAAATELVVEVDALDARHTERPEARTFDLELPFGNDVDVSVQVRAEGCIPLGFTGIQAAELADPWKIELQPMPGIVGRVTFQGEPVPRARLHASHRCDPGEWHRRRGGLESIAWSAGWDHRAGRDGTFYFPLQWEGDWVLRVRARGFADALVDVSGYDPASGRELLDVELVRPGGVEGSVRDASGAPRTRTRVVASHGEHEARVVRSDRDGRYRFDDLPPGDWMIHAPHTADSGSGWSTLVLGDHWELPTNVSVKSGATAVLDLGSTLRGVTVQFDATGGVLSPNDLQVLQASGADGDPLMLLQPQRTEAAEDGSFELLLPTAGRVDVSLRSASFAGSATWTLDCAGMADEVTLDLPLATLDLSGPPGSRIVLKGTPIRGGAPRVYHAVTLDENGAREGLLVVASELAAQVIARGEPGNPARLALEPGTRQRLVLD